MTSSAGKLMLGEILLTQHFSQANKKLRITFCIRVLRHEKGLLCMFPTIRYPT